MARGLNQTSGELDGSSKLTFKPSADDIGDALGSVAPDFGSSDNGDGFDPAIHIGRDKRNADGSYRRKRERNANGGNSGSRNPRKSSAENKASVETLSRILAIVHTALAGVTKAPELELEEKEAESLAGATANVLSQFNIAPDPKIEAIVGLVTVAGMIYGPRVYLIRERLKAEGAKPVKQDVPFQQHPYVVT
jgi:hypothetical protein